ncbi:HNH endonuclease [Flavobacterium sp. ACN2]|uniref:HNH endonuclease n=1 Tax=Flavobacterium sp. ACN2 TaxID=1975676 RepID=UPI0015579CC4|nr:HNH endonuclease signature motif containing protein [Flavobacterium sp. ACN2]PBI82680.1 HNH endonuclease [Flavobacterium sp. ACN2]
MSIREAIPIRRNKPTKSEEGNNYTKHKPDLQKDFNFSCGYCGAFDGFGYTKTYFEIDHFVPKDFLLKSKSKIGLSKYSNLVYSCRFCNNNKTKHWPSQRDDVYVINEEGFVEPCDIKYESNLYRTEEGSIMWSTPIGKWMATVAFKFDERTEEIKLLWKYNKTRIAIEKIIDELNRYPDNSNEYKKIKSELLPLFEKHYFLQKELATFYNG